MIGRSLIRTGFRLIVTIWDSCNQALVDWLFIKMQLITGPIIKFHSSMSQSIAARYLKSKNQDSETLDEKLRRKTDSVASLMIMIIFVSVLGIPLVPISLVYGYQTITQYLLMGICLSSATTILIVNFTSRIHKSVMVLYSFRHLNEDYSINAIQRAGYLASNKYDTGHSIIHTSGKQLTILGFWIVASAIIFSTFDVNSF